MARPSGVAPTLPERPVGAVAQQAEYRRHAEQDACGERRGDHEREDGSDGGNFARSGDSARHESNDSTESRHGETEAQDTAADRNHQMLGQRFADQAWPGGTQCGAEFHLGSPGQTPRENEMRHIRAGDQEHQPGSPEERPERHSKGRARHLVVERDHGDAEPGVLGRIRLLEPRCDLPELLARPVEGDSWQKPAHDAPRVGAAPLAAWSQSGESVWGIQASVTSPGIPKCAGITPTTSRVVPLMSSVRPTTSREPANRRVQSPWLNTATDALSRSSSTR